ncbi:MAG: DUF368 domain-containing protein [Lachnospiraceae bacterium]|nr:DUF368 domain-containing protein [Lachnospiraceae bacterium]
MKEFLKDVAKGAVMGVANIIPGVSGGTMAVSMGIYDKLITSVTHLFQSFKKSVMTLLPIVIGMLVGIVGLSFVIEYLFGSFPFETNLLFIGLIIGGLPMIVKNVKGAKFSISYAIAFLLFFVLVVGMALLGEVDGAAKEVVLNPWNLIILFLIGIIAAATMIIPGVSGSMVLMLLGYYNTIINAITDLVRALKDFDMAGILHQCGILIPFGIGVLLGIFTIAKLIEILFAKAPVLTFWAIIGLIVASPFAIVLMNREIFLHFSFVHVVFGVIALAIGFVIAMFLGKEENSAEDMKSDSTSQEA